MEQPASADVVWEWGGDIGGSRMVISYGGSYGGGVGGHGTGGHNQQYPNQIG